MGFHDVTSFAMATTDTEMTLRLLVDKKANKVLFAEAGKDFIDFLFSLLSLPLGSVVRVLTKTHMVGCIGNVSQSVKEISDTYINFRDMLLKPKAPASAVNSPFLLAQQPAPSKTYYMCGTSMEEIRKHARCYRHTCSYDDGTYCDRGVGSYHTEISNIPNTKCPTCSSIMLTQLTNISSDFDETVINCAGTGYVKGVVTYMVMDDLVVTPISTISSITALKRFNVENVFSVEEKVVNVGMEQGLELLKASLQSKTVLSDVFLEGI